MGNPMSPVLVEIIMNYIKEEIQSNPLTKYFISWNRYVDYILACLIGTHRPLDISVGCINSIHPNIRFTVEADQDISINIYGCIDNFLVYKLRYGMWFIM